MVGLVRTSRYVDGVVEMMLGLVVGVAKVRCPFDVRSMSVRCPLFGGLKRIRSGPATDLQRTCDGPDGSSCRSASR